MLKYYDSKLKLLTENWKKIVRKRLVESAVLSGEYWIIDGSPVFADGDIGDMNHEAHVISYLTSQFANLLGIDKDDVPHLQYLEDQIKHNFIEDGLIEKGEESEEKYDNDPASFILEYLKQNYLHVFNNNEKQLTDAFFLAYGSSGRNDARDYGMKYLGWIRVQGNNIQTWTLTSEDMSNITRGISSVIEQEIGSEEDDLQDLTFNVESMTNKKYYSDVPFEVIDSGDVTKLLAYR